MKTLRTIGTVAVTGAILTLLPVGSASADETDATFTLATGSLIVDGADDAAPLTGSSAGVDAFSVSGLLGDVTVTDNRGVVGGWIVSASSSPFTSLTTATASTGVTYLAPTPTTSGTVTAVSEGSATVSGGGAPVVTATGVSGNNTALFNPTLTVGLPGGALAGTYTGTVTTSVA